MHHESIAGVGHHPTDNLLTKLSEQNHQQGIERVMSEATQMPPRTLDHQSSCSSLPIGPATETFAPTAPTTRSASATPNESQRSADEVRLLQLQLEQAQSKINRLDQELSQSRTLTQRSGRSTPGAASDAAYSTLPMDMDSPNAPRPPFRPASNQQTFTRENGWGNQEDGRSETSDPVVTGPFSRNRSFFNKSGFQNTFPQPPQVPQDSQQTMQWPGERNIVPGYGEPSFGPTGGEQYRIDRMSQDQDMMRPMAGRRGNRYDNRFGQAPNYGANFGGYGNTMSPYDTGASYSTAGNASISGPVMGMGMGAPPFSAYQQQQQPVGTPLSPHATEFTSAGTPWKAQVSLFASMKSTPSRLTLGSKQPLAPEGQTYLPATEPLNYRRLLDRNVTCDWKYIVDKIVCNNDQQASIFLQQKLKVGTPQQKYDIVEAIVAQAYPLMVNRFGNFLVQRCFEHGSPEQVVKIAEAIRGNTLNLSMDPFGCHVVQKAFDSVPEDYKAIMVHELLRRIPETVIHRYACHVWQKLFELRWTESPPQIMKYVNEALRGMWHEVALGETGSLVVQNIFENCLEEDKVRLRQFHFVKENASRANHDFSVRVLRKFWPTLTSLHMGNSEIGAFSTYASMALRQTGAVPSIMSFDTRPSIAWTSLRPKLSKNV